MTEDFGNPSAMHMVGVKAENILKKHRKYSKIIKVDPKEISLHQVEQSQIIWLLLEQQWRTNVKVTKS